MSDRQQVTNARGERIAIVAGLRTPFAKQATAFHGVSALDMGKMVVNELLSRSELDPKTIEQLVYGQVVQMPAAPNIAREIVLGTGMDVSTDAYSVTRACATSFQSAVNVAESIMTGNVEIEGESIEFEMKFDGESMEGIVYAGDDELVIKAERQK